VKKLFLSFIIGLFFFGCNSTATQTQTDVKPKLVVGASLEGVTLVDQFDKSVVLDAKLHKLVFAFSKDAAHLCNDFFNTQKADFLPSHNSAFVADVSAAPSLIRSLFIMPGLKDFKHQVLLLTDENEAKPYIAGQNTKKILAVTLDNLKITNITTILTKEQLKEFIEK
jgi:hypothetical protein